MLGNPANLLAHLTEWLREKESGVSEMNERDFDQLVASVNQAGAIKRGKMEPGRRVQTNTADIETIRKKRLSAQPQRD